MNDVLRTVDGLRDVVLVMLDLSAAFDTLEHTILLDRLSRYFGFSHTVLRWISSYLTGRIQSITIGNTTSSSRIIEFGAPRGSILGPLLFILYTGPIHDIISAHNLDCMFYADDSQLYITIDPHDQRLALNNLQKCISEVTEWNTISKLVFNPSKAEVIQFSFRFVKNPILSDVLIGNARVQPSDRVCNLGVNLDRELNLSHHINETCKTAMLAIQFIGRLWKYLSKEQLKMMVNAFITSRLDYFSSLYGGLPK